MESKADKHKRLSYSKSAYRILGYVLLLVSIKVAVVFLILSELLGIAEEVYGS